MPASRLVAAEKEGEDEGEEKGVLTRRIDIVEGKRLKIVEVIRVGQGARILKVGNAIARMKGY